MSENGIRKSCQKKTPDGENEKPEKKAGENQEGECSTCMCFLKKLIDLKKVITVEPLVGFYYMASFLSKPALDNLEFEMTCRVNLQYDDSICDAIAQGRHKNHTLYNDNIQVLISNMHSWQQPVQSFMPLMLVLFLGSFSDRYKLRKPFVILPLVGELLGTVGCIFCAINMKSWPLEVQGVLQRVVPSLFGGQTMLAMATTAYIADVSSTEMRTLRFGVVQIVISLAGPLVNSFSGILYLTIGYVGILSISALLFLLAFTFGIFCIDEKKVTREKREVCLIADILDPKHAIDTFRVIYRKSPGVDRTHICIMMFMVFIQRSAYDGETNILYLYVQNVFQWTPVEYSYFLTINGVILLAGNVCGLPLFTRIFRLSDHMIIFVCILTKNLSNVAFGLATTSLTFYIGSLVSVITRMYRVAKKSLSTKIVSESDIGKFQSLMGICETLAPAVAVPIYNVIYINTLDILPAAIFFFSILLYAFCCILILGMYYLARKNYGEKGIGAVVNEKTDYNSDIIDTVHL
ncbi:hypothetical protein JTB14_016535 [Gonioctena quinquepunctata]|nr:hypothetical protein JTB14_016535 [Gonioctena quinquepunctata]